MAQVTLDLAKESSVQELLESVTNIATEEFVFGKMKVESSSSVALDYNNTKTYDFVVNGAKKIKRIFLATVDTNGESIGVTFYDTNMKFTIDGTVYNVSSNSGNTYGFDHWGSVNLSHDITAIQGTPVFIVSDSIADKVPIIICNESFKLTVTLRPGRYTHVTHMTVFYEDL